MGGQKNKESWIKNKKSKHANSKSVSFFKIINFTIGKLIATNECQFVSDGSASTFRVMFDEPVEVLANVTYVASANLSVGFF